MIRFKSKFISREQWGDNFSFHDYRTYSLFSFFLLQVSEPDTGQRLLSSRLALARVAVVWTKTRQGGWMSLVLQGLWCSLCVCGQRDGKCFPSPRIGALDLVALSVWFKERLQMAQAEGWAVGLLVEGTSHQKSEFLWLLSGLECLCCLVLHVASEQFGTERGVTMQRWHLLGLKRRSWFGCKRMGWGLHMSPNITPLFRRKSRDVFS